MPLAQIVNEYDEIIGHKERSKIDPVNDIYRVSALFVVNSHGEILIAQRKFTKKNSPGIWGPAVAGTVEDDETYESNIYKEAAEEIGLTDDKFTIGSKTHPIPTKNYFVQWYIAHVDKPLSAFTPQEEEVEKLAWVPRHELLKRIEEHPENFVSRMKEYVEVMGA